MYCASSTFGDVFVRDQLTCGSITFRYYGWNERDGCILSSHIHEYHYMGWENNCLADAAYMDLAVCFAITSSMWWYSHQLHWSEPKKSQTPLGIIVQWTMMRGEGENWAGDGACWSVVYSIPASADTTRPLLPVLPSSVSDSSENLFKVSISTMYIECGGGGKELHSVLWGLPPTLPFAIYTPKMRFECNRDIANKSSLGIPTDVMLIAKSGDLVVDSVSSVHGTFDNSSYHAKAFVETFSHCP